MTVPLAPSVSESSIVDPSRKLTVPVGVPAPAATKSTLAVNVTDSPKTEEEGVALSVVLVPAWLTHLARGRGARHEVRVAAIDRCDRV